MSARRVRVEVLDTATLVATNVPTRLRMVASTVTGPQGPTGRPATAQADEGTLRPGWAWTAYSTTANTTAMTANRLYVNSLRTPSAVPCLVDRMAFTVDVAGSAGAVVRLGIYGAAVSGGIGALVLDAGTVDVTTTGTKELAVSAVLDPGDYFFGIVAQGGATTQPTVRHVNSTQGAYGIATVFGAANIRSCFYMNGVSGALPNTVTLDGRFNDNAAPAVAIRLA